jgi:hypothetical protein
MLSERFDEALAYASRVHRHQRRTGSLTPYLSHLLAVASLTLENGGDEDQAIAALLHDAAEDQGGRARLADIEARFGAAVAAIVADCTDAFEEPKPAWLPRKIAYVESLRAKPASSLLVSLADKTHNVRSIVADFAAVGPAVFSRFTGGRDGTLWYYRALRDAFGDLLPGRLARLFDRDVSSLDELDRLGAGSAVAPPPVTHSVSIVRGGRVEVQLLHDSSDDWARQYADVLRRLPGAQTPDDVRVTRETAANRRPSASQ